MKGNLKKRILFILLILSYLLFSYYAFGKWWHSSVGSILIVFFSYLIWKKDFLINTGLNLNLITLIKSIILAVVIILFSFLIMKYIAGKHGVIIKYTDWRDYYHDFFYILNEEIVIGAIMLFWLVDKRRIRPIAATAGLAIFFALIHFVFYKWIFLDRGVIGISALTTLFLIGFVRNSLIILTQHIGYSWALHFGWMTVMFGSMHIYSETNLRLTELERFNTYLGSAWMVIISALAAGLTLLYLIKKGSFRATSD